MLWKEEKTNVEEVKVYLETLKTVESVQNEYNFKQVFKQVLTDTKYNAKEVKILEITKISEEKYSFIIYHIILRFRFRIIGWYSVERKEVIIESVEEVFSEKLQEMKEPEQPKIKVITKESLTKNVEAKEVFDYLYKVQPTFRQNLVQNIKVEESK